MEATWIAIFCHQSVIRIEVVDLVRSHLSSQFTPTVFSFIYLYQDRVDTKLRTMHLLSLIFHLFYSGSRCPLPVQTWSWQDHSLTWAPPTALARASSLCFCPGLRTTLVRNMADARSARRPAGGSGRARAWASGTAAWPFCTVPRRTLCYPITCHALTHCRSHSNSSPCFVRILVSIFVFIMHACIPFYSSIINFFSLIKHLSKPCYKYIILI